MHVGAPLRFFCDRRVACDCVLGIRLMRRAEGTSCCCHVVDFLFLSSQRVLRRAVLIRRRLEPC